MPFFILLTRPNGSDFWVNANCIHRIESSTSGGSVLILPGEAISITQSPHQIIKLTLEPR
jgi:uncharacterized protein YlzI (FlbEa/FlbD family)